MKETLEELLERWADEKGILRFTVDTEDFTPYDWEMLTKLLLKGAMEHANPEALS